MKSKSSKSLFVVSSHQCLNRDLVMNIIQPFCSSHHSEEDNPSTNIWRHYSGKLNLNRNDLVRWFE